MSEIKTGSALDRKKSLRSVLLLCVVCIAIDLAGAKIATVTGIPLFLDSVGTILAAVLGGYIPGIAVGYIFNLINAIGWAPSAYYASISVIIAVIAAFFSHRGYFNKFRGLAATAVTIGLVGGSLASVLTWVLDGLDFTTGISAPLAHYLYENAIDTPFWAQLSADLIVDVSDKIVVVIIVAVILKLLPEDLKDRFHYFEWNLRNSGRDSAFAYRNRVMSLRAKVVQLIAIAMLVVTVAATAVSFALYHHNSIEMHTVLGEGVANLVVDQIDPDKVDEYIELGESAEGYLDVEDALYKIRSSSMYAEYVYVYKILEDGCHVVFDLDTEDLPGGEPGDVVEFDESFVPLLPKLFAGEEIDPIISDDSFGWLLTVYKPVYDSEGVCRCYAAVDISMHDLELGEYSLLAKVIALFLGFFILIFFIGLWFAEDRIVAPINSLASAAGDFAYNSEAARAENLHNIRALDIRTGDEIENLYKAMEKTTEDTVSYINEVNRKSETINRLQNGLVFVLADMVESRDKCTGDHVRKTAAYAHVIMEEMRKDGFYTDMITDDFISDVTNTAPMHDIGKIRVSDMLLNKPGKLTDEEFTQMKEHTLYGEGIIAQVIEMVGDDSGTYLKEASNLAAYHHERWNGTGYPRGLKGEEIPLSARVMAVADVFDALVSQRSYKKPFSIEEALQIIKDGSGSHFDPKVVDAFLNAEPEIRKVAELHMRGSI